MSAYTLHQQKYPYARRSSLEQKARQDAVTEQLRREIAENQKKRRRSWLFWIWRRA